MRQPGQAVSRFSVVITTFNRAHVLLRAIDSVLGQQGAELELVIVDDGSTDETPMLLSRLDDPRVIWLRRPNGGLGAARNTGLARASGAWVAFLDDDDVALPGWLEAFSSMVDLDVGAVFCAAEYRSYDGTLVDTALPGPMGPLFEHQTGMVSAGSWAARTELLRAVGGYDERLTCSHQTDLLVRLTTEMAERGLGARHTDRVLVTIEARPPDGRPMASPAALYNGTRILLDKHREKLARDPHGRAALNGVLGVSAARLGAWSHARSAFLASVMAEPRRRRHWLRLGAACLPPIGRRVWSGAVQGLPRTE
jgi:glycosyltransferase involved in cell wall biosynthesis